MIRQVTKSLCVVSAALCAIALGCQADVADSDEASPVSGLDSNLPPYSDAATTQSDGSVYKTQPDGGFIVNAQDAASHQPDGKKSSAVGQGQTPFNPKQDGSSGVKLDPKGNVVLDPSEITESKSLIWVANSAEGSISKIDTRTMKELARYRTGPGNADPSRTTVSLDGDVVVANRGGASVTKISSDLSRCKGKGTGTSTGPTDVRQWGDDKCILWHVPFSAGALCRAAAFDAERGVDGEVSTSAWIGLYRDQKMVQLDSATGKQLAVIDVAPISPYGAAVDKDHNVWVWGAGSIGKIHAPTKKFTIAPSPPCAYGIAADPKGRVWTSGGPCVARFSPTTNLWEKISVGASNRGLAVDAKGSVWVADTAFGVHQLNMETMAVVKSIGVDAAAKSFVGMAVDFDGKIWAINQAGNAAVRIDPTTYAQTTVPVGNGPYTYSDMTGFQLRNATGASGKYLHVFQGCGAATQWKTLSWSAETPDGTQIEVRARIAASEASLPSTPWVLVAKQPSDKSPVDLKTKMGASANKGVLEVEFTLKPGQTYASSPVIRGIDASYSCDSVVN